MPKRLTPAQIKQRSNAGKIGGRVGGRKGGLATLAKHGREHYVALGKLGGRPTWGEALAKAQAQEAERKSRSGPGPGRPRKSHPVTGERKELTAPAVAYQV